MKRPRASERHKEENVAGIASLQSAQVACLLAQTHRLRPQMGGRGERGTRLATP